MRFSLESVNQIARFLQQHFRLLRTQDWMDMRSKVWAIATFLLTLVAVFLVSVYLGQAEPSPQGFFQWAQATTDQAGLSQASTDCALQPPKKPSNMVEPPLPAREATLARFRKQPSQADSLEVVQPGKTFSDAPKYMPKERIALAHPTNYGRRFLRDLNGQPVMNLPIIVLHETVGSAQSVVNYFRAPHYRDADQVSYHSLIARDGTVIYLVPPDRRAFGAGNSLFRSDRGIEGVKTHPAFPPSVNNFAYHIALETPSDGMHNGRSHSGYTNAQYQSLAWLIAKTNIPDDRITTHQGVDRSGSRRDPRSFNAQLLRQLLSTYPRTNDIAIACTLPQSERAPVAPDNPPRAPKDATTEEQAG